MTQADTPRDPEPKRALGSGRGGPIRTAFRAIVRDLEETGAIRPIDRLTIALGARIADVVDDASRSRDAELLVRSSTRLEVLVGKLPTGKAPASGGGSERDDSSRGNGDGHVLELVDGPPTLGDTA